MKPRRLILTLLPVALLGALAWFIFRAPPEPSYQGKPLRKWLALYTQGTIINTNQQADEAVRHLGTNALPTLLQLLQDRDGPLKTKFISLLQQLHFPLPLQRATYPNYQAGMAFQALGPDAAIAVPALVQIYRKKISVASQREVLRALGSIGPKASPEATPVLLDGLTNSNTALRLHAEIAVAQIHGQPEVFVPLLMDSLKNPDRLLRRFTASALAAYGPQAQPAVPALTALLSDPDPAVNSAVTQALRQIDPAAAQPGIK
jgi:hypothetical protein